MATIRRTRRTWLAVLAVICGAALIVAPLLVRGSAGALAHADAHTSVHTEGTYTPQKRVYYIAAEELPWNYAPSGKNQITGKAFDETADVFVKGGPDRIGNTYIKALYREYADATFTTLTPQAAEWKHLGMLGPMIRAVVGDTVKVVLQEQRPLGRRASTCTASATRRTPRARRTSTAPAGRSRTTTPCRRARPTPTSTRCPRRAGPGPMDGSSVMWMYHSHTDEVADDYAGLMGPVVVTARGHGATRTARRRTSTVSSSCSSR